MVSYQNPFSEQTSVATFCFVVWLCFCFCFFPLVWFVWEQNGRGVCERKMLHILMAFEMLFKILNGITIEDLENQSYL